MGKKKTAIKAVDNKKYIPEPGVLAGKILL
jgi:hypothetical protein